MQRLFPFYFCNPFNGKEGDHMTRKVLLVIAIAVMIFCGLKCRMIADETNARAAQIVVEELSK